MANNIVYADTNLPVTEIPATVVKYSSFSSAQTNTALWTPASGKSIYLTAVSISSLITLSVSLQRSGNGVFLVAGFAAVTPLPYSTSFFSPVKFNTNESITVTTSTGGQVYITLVGYEA